MHRTLTVIWLIVLPLVSLGYCISSSPTLPFPITKSTSQDDLNYTLPTFPILPFIKYTNNPILKPNPLNKWESAYVYNPTAIVLNQTIFLLYRAQDQAKTSSIGLAWSTDGYTFTRYAEPIVYPTEAWELRGGTEDPRLVRINGTFYLTYTAYDLNTPQLCLATSEDLLNWTKYPPIFPGFEDTTFTDQGVEVSRVNHTKSGAIITEPTSHGLYHMYFGDSVFYHATSTDLLTWTPDPKPFAKPIHPWEDGLIEPGPAPVKTRDGKWLLIYNAMTTGTDEYRPTQYSVGQMLLDPEKFTSTHSMRPHWNDKQHHSPQIPLSPQKIRPRLQDPGPVFQRPLARLETPFLTPTTREEEHGQVDLVVFAEGLVQFRGKWFLYYGQADQTVGVAVAHVE
ncbi:hypothetical protein PV10_01147 [Exophiala mesophila]|uniref:Glycosyl hydrolase family 32 N-terminal domain-containing protein n=1 Tax=Exophiala mesophila TaxID=212818 RepID=A0A0D1Y9R4_EXOME|nr:uncharacterized protein PV10_01147 [Exophiala mesophila]KIV97391.1 hypothetical protein PV10_01147 [Exophiala mesophila]